jgi:hypothetical protein
MGDIAAERHVRALERRLKAYLASCGCIRKLILLAVGYAEKAMLFVELREVECIAVAHVKMKLKASMRWLVRVRELHVLIAACEADSDAVSLGIFGLVGMVWGVWVRMERLDRLERLRAELVRLGG